MKKYISITLSTLTLLTCFTGCGDKKSSGKSNIDSVETQTAALSTVAATDKEHRDDDQDTIQKALEEQKKVENKTSDESESGIMKHKDRPNEGYYLEDYMTVEFRGYEHDSECEVTVDWDKLADDLGNGVTPEILETIYSFRFRDTKAHSDDVDDLVNGDRINLITSEETIQDAFKQKYSKELKYIDENLLYYDKTPVIVSGLKSKAFIENTSDIDKAAIQKITDEKMNEIKNAEKDFDDAFENDYGAESITSVLNLKYDIMGNTHNCKINDFTVVRTYFVKRTAGSYNDISASTLPENMVFNIYKLSLEQYGTGEILDLYYRVEIGNLLYEDGKMVISDDTVKVQFAGTAEELMPDSKYWEIEEVK